MKKAVIASAILLLSVLFTVNTSFGQAEPKFAWGKITQDVIIEVLIIFCIGVLLMIAIFNNSKHIRVIRVTIISLFGIASLLFAFRAIANFNLIKEQAKRERELTENSKENTSKIFTRSEVEEFMVERAKKINQTIQEIKESTNSNGDKIYLFLSVAINGYVCITTVSSIELEVLAAKCEENYVNILELWQMID